MASSVAARSPARGTAKMDALRELSKGLKVAPQFCPTDVADPFETVQWELRSAQIKDENGKLMFEQKDAEIPAFWTQLATNVVVSKYFYGENGAPERERSVRQLIHRVTRTIADWGQADGYFATADDAENFYRELTWLCLHQHGAFNSPVWFNVGLHHVYGVRGDKCNWRWNPETMDVEQPENPYEFPQGSACFIQSVEDNMEAIMSLATSEAMLFKFGSGTGTDLSTLRSHREKLSGGGKPSGPLSFMRVYDQIAAVVKSGGKTRRAAKMQSLKIWHPDILDFIECKWKEEKKAHCLIEKGGYEANFNGEAYSSILFQNANLSVRVTDEYMQAIEKNQRWATHWVTEPTREGPSWPARELLNRMAECAWHCGDPGVQYDTTINNWHTCPNSGRINASNPCVTGDTLVATEDGLRTIASLVGEQPNVVGLDGRLHRATRVFETGVKPVYRLRTKSGYELKLTLDHRVWTGWTGRRDVPAGDLRPGDQIELRRISFGRDSVSADVAAGLGERLGRGGTDVFELFGLHPELQLIRQRFAGGGVVCADDTATLLFNLSRTSIAALIRGFYTAQGANEHEIVFGAGRTYIELQHPTTDILRQVQLLLLGFGIKSRICEDTELGLIHRLHILPPFVESFRKLVSNDWIVSLPSWCEKDEFESLELIGEEPVFDLTEPQLAHFVANGIVVHNCSEYMFLDNTACNLASINLMKFRQPDGTFDVERFKAACRIYFIAQEILVDHASYPTPDIARNSHLYRPLGLGYSNLGSVLMSEGLPYDSEAAYGVCGSLTAILHGTANLTSAEMAAVVGPFEGFHKNREPMLRVMQMHRDAVENINPAGPEYLQDAARKLWDEVLSLGKRFGYRNAQATVLAPTGTISFMMDCDTTGIEPDIALVKYKQLAGGGMLKIVNQTVPAALKKLGYDDPTIQATVKYIDEHDTIEGAPQLLEEHLPVFDCAFKPANGVRSINWRAHVRMMAAAQPFLSGAISKTVNMPSDVTPTDIADAYFWGWQLGLKALAIYRDGSKQSQPLSTKSEGTKDKEEKAVMAKPRRERLPDTRNSITHKFNVGGHEGYINVGLYPSDKPGEQGRPGELFITMAKEGSTVGGMMDAFGTAISMSLQYGVPLEDLVNKFSHMRFEPMGHTTNPDIRIAKSVVDYIFRWMGIRFLAGYHEAHTGLNEKPTAPTAEDTSSRPASLKATQSSPLAPREEALAPATAKAPAKAAATQGRSASEGSGSGSANGANGHSKKENGTALRIDGNGPAVTSNAGRSDQFARFQLDAPSCDNCGAITVRNGNCYLCHNCGNSMGCS